MLEGLEGDVGGAGRGCLNEAGASELTTQNLEFSVDLPSWWLPLYRLISYKDKRWAGRV